jgi:hypothetical protein
MRRRLAVTPRAAARVVHRAFALAALLVGVSLVAAPVLARAPAPTSVAFFYGEDPPWPELAAFDWVVVEPDHAPRPIRMAGSRTAFLAYVSVGEASPSRRWFADLPAAWRVGENAAWGSTVIDQRPADWPAFLVERIVRPLWDAGYRGFFLDTLDSYRIVASSDDALREQQAGLVRAIRAVRAAFPEAKLVFNRGFEILPELHADVAAVAVESFLEGWDPAARRYRPVPDADRETLLAITRRLAEAHGLPIIAIDYVPTGEREKARTTAARLRSQGFVPWVANVEHTQLGVGTIEVMPRRVLMLHDGGRGAAALAREHVARYATLPLQWLGYVPEFVDITRDALPAQPLAGRYAGIVLWLYGDDEAHRARLEPLVARARAEGVRIAVFGRFGIPAGAATDALFGTRGGSASADPAPVRIAARTSSIGFEIEPIATRHEFRPLAARDAEVWLRIADERGATQDAVAITPWGGYALAPHDIVFLPANRGARWVVDPVRFLARALDLPPMPVPDVTSEAGRRLLLVRVTGDGLATPVDAPGRPPGRGPLAGSVLLREILEPRALPTAFAPPAADGSAPARALTERTIALPFVEPAQRSALVPTHAAPTRAERSITLVPPYALPRADADGSRADPAAGLDVHAPNASDGLYTQGGAGPLAGFARVIETFELTGAPHRLTPVDVHYHAGAAARRVTLDTLRGVYDWAAREPLRPAFASDYARQVRDFHRMVIARDADGAWLVRGAGALRQIRLPLAAGVPDLAASTGIAGWNVANDARYVHLAGPDARLALGAAPDAPQPRVDNANGRITAFARTTDGFTATIDGHVPIAFDAADVETCEVRVNDAHGARDPDDNRGGPQRQDRLAVIRRGASERLSYGNGNTHGGSRATIVCRR